MTDQEKIIKVCEECGKEFEALGDWQKVCRDCYHKKAETASGKAKATSKAKPVAAASTIAEKIVPLDPDTVLEELKKTYDEVVAEFQSDYPESIGNSAVLHSIVATVFIEKNLRKKAQKLQNYTKR